jgi:hypothetical protein
VYNGKFIFVHSRDLGFGQSDCPFRVQSFDEIERLLKDMPLLDLIHRINGLMSNLSLGEQMRFNLNDFVTSYDDFSGRVRFLQALWDGQVLGVVRVPLYFVDKEMARWLYANQSLDFTLSNNPKQEEAKAAVTDAMAGQPAAQAGPPSTPSKKPPVKKEAYHIRLNIDPKDKDSQEDTFALFSTDAAKSYSKTLTVKDDQVPGDSYTDLSFPDLDMSLSYSLKIDLGNDGHSYFLFENTPYGELHG